MKKRSKAGKENMSDNSGVIADSVNTSSDSDVSGFVDSKESNEPSDTASYIGVSGGTEDVITQEEEVSLDVDDMVMDAISEDSENDDGRKITKLAASFMVFEALLFALIITCICVLGYVLTEVKKQNDISVTYLSELSSVRDEIRRENESYELRQKEQMEENARLAMFLEEEKPEEDDGFYITLGAYEQDGDESNGAEPIEWAVLGSDDKGTLLVSRYVLDCMPYNDEEAPVTWEDSSLRGWLNDDFLGSAFSDEERLMINTVTLNQDDNARWDTTGGDVTGDKVFCLSVSDIKKYYEIDCWFTEDEPDELGRYEIGYSDLLITKPTEYASEKGAFSNSFDEDAYEETYEALGYEKKYIGRKGCAWWLRTPGYDETFACKVSSDGLAGDGDSMIVTADTVGVRPAIYVSRI